MGVRRLVDAAPAPRDGCARRSVDELVETQQAVDDFIVVLVLDGDDLKTGLQESGIDLPFLDKGIMRPGGRSVKFEDLAEQFLEIRFLNAGAKEQQRTLPKDLRERPPEMERPERDAAILFVPDDELSLQDRLSALLRVQVGTRRVGDSERLVEIALDRPEHRSPGHGERTEDALAVLVRASGHR